MKPAAAFGILAFFLFLNSGIFVCAPHYIAAKPALKPDMQMACHHCSKCCGNDKNHSCDKKHSNSSIKENTQPGYSIRFHMPFLTLLQTPATAFPVDHLIQPYQVSIVINKALPATTERI